IISIWCGIDDMPLSFKVFVLMLSSAFSIYWKKLISLRLVTIIGGMCYTIYMLHQRILYLVLGNFKPKQLIADNIFIDVITRAFIYLIPLSIVCTLFFIFVE